MVFEHYVGNLVILELGLRSDLTCSLYVTPKSIKKIANSCSVVKEQRNHNTKAPDTPMYSCTKGKVNFNIVNAPYPSIIQCKGVRTTTQHQAVIVV